jgi:hypothetical protein
MQGAKPFNIDRWLIFEAFKSVKSNKGSAGIDGVTIEQYESNLKPNLYKLWNRMSSGSYLPKSVRLVEIPKSNGGKRPLGIPTVEDRIAQMAAVKMISPILEPNFLRSKSHTPLELIAESINPVIKGWINYYGKFEPMEMRKVMMELNVTLVRWAKAKYMHFKRKSLKIAYRWLGEVACRSPMFYHWQLGIYPKNVTCY